MLNGLTLNREPNIVLAAIKKSFNIIKFAVLFVIPRPIVSKFGLFFMLFMPSLVGKFYLYFRMLLCLTQ